MSLGIYLVGYLILIGGVTYGMHLAHIPQHWIVVVDLVLVGAAILTGVTSTRQKDPS
ncbi:hypothetical protein [Terriglobus saanensis]|uniref:Uncharacterized protein n=1 Tax=Terriglobus saanensis (strain ATCC BAA-1853 / DSM 23119 / SP1PR4) TaxID=401053 RepID=E8V6S3_TERSS|nr:hypothetical protein [Terriglobus saanensis]ADV83875.1 hypothetical protein AciPR4_3117 [Terriglobus saanensis SP1PR4]